MPRFRVRYRNAHFDLPTGVFVVGRAPGCELVLDDPRVSRRHTRFHVDAQRLTVEDLKSRNGTLVNGVLLRAPLVLADRDLVTIGSQELRVIALQATDEQVAAVAPAAFKPEFVSPPDDPTETGGTLAHFTRFERAMRLGVYDEAEVILREIYREFGVESRPGRLRDPASLRQYRRATLAHATATHRGTHLDALFAIHHRAGVVIPAQAIEEMHALVRSLRAPLSPAVRAYVEWLRAEAEHLGSAERFALQQVEALVHTMRVHTR